MPPEVALLHHYRQCETAGNYCKEDTAFEFVMDRTIYKYRDILLNRITKTRDRLNKNCLIEANIKSKIN